MWHAWERGEKCTGFWWESPKEKDHLQDQGVDRRLGSKRTLGRLAGERGYGVDAPGSGYGQLAGSCESSDESSGSGAMESVGIICVIKK
jgi:hypothetical protein